MSTANMVERIPKAGGREVLTRDAFTVPYSYLHSNVETTEGLLWRQVMRTLRKHWKASLAFALIIELALGMLVLAMKNTYEAHAVLDIEPPGAEAIGPDSNTVANPANTPGYLDTQTEILGSDGLALSVIKKLQLDHNPIFLDQTPLQKSVAWIESLLPGKKLNAQTDNQKLVDIFHRGLTVGQVKDSQLVDVSYETRDPELASQIANATIDQYFDETFRSRYDTTLRAAKSLSPQLADLQDSVKKSDDALLDFQKTHEGAELGGASSITPDGTTNVGSAGNENLVALRVGGLNQQLTEAMGDRLQQESYLKQIQIGDVDSLPQMKDNVLIQGLTSRLVDSRAQLAQALAIYGSNDPQVRKLELESEEIDKQLQNERTRIASQIESAYSSAQNRERLIRNTLNQMKGELDRSNADVVQYDVLKREADSSANLYTTLSSKIKELEMSGSIISGNIRVVDAARPPVQPNGPHRFRILGIGAMFGIFGGVLLAFAAENMSDTVCSVDDVRHCAELPTLALVPKISIPGSPRLALSSDKRARVLPTNSISAIHEKGMKFLTDHPNSPEAEAIRNLETAIRLSPFPGQKSVQTVLVTSALPGEGKTTIATNLALALARHGNTCLIDSDLRHPSITQSFGLSQYAGLQDLLTSPEGSIQSIVKPHPDVPNLTVVGVGNRFPYGLELLASKHMEDLIKELRKQFDYIVLDSPPVIPFSQGRWLSTLSDVSILVARCDATTRGAISWSLEILEELKANVLGVVLNGVDLDAEYYSYGVKGYPNYSGH